MAIDSASDSPGAESASASPPAQQPVMGERSRQFLLERQQARPAHLDPTLSEYRVPALAPRKNPDRRIRNAVIILHVVFGLFWALFGVMTTLAFLGDGTAINHRAAAVGVALTSYGGVCFWLAIALYTTARWALPTSHALCWMWIALLLLGIWFQTIWLALFVPFAGFILWALRARRAQFVDPD